MTVHIHIGLMATVLCHGLPLFDTNVTFGKSNNVPSFSCGVDVSVHNGDNLSGVIVVKFDHTFGIAHTEKVITLFVVY